jgi:oxaloacetate decarboxylase gamma subunit
MGQENLIEQGLELMLFGMGSVVIFLSLLVLATNLMSSLIIRFIPPAVETTPERPGLPVDAQLLAVISAAIHQHRSRQTHD